MAIKPVVLYPDPINLMRHDIIQDNDYLDVRFLDIDSLISTLGNNILRKGSDGLLYVPKCCSSELGTRYVDPRTEGDSGKINYPSKMFPPINTRATPIGGSGSSSSGCISCGGSGSSYSSGGRYYDSNNSLGNNATKPFSIGDSVCILNLYDCVSGECIIVNLCGNPTVPEGWGDACTPSIDPDTLSQDYTWLIVNEGNGTLLSQYYGFNGSKFLTVYSRDRAIEVTTGQVEQAFKEARERNYLTPTLLDEHEAEMRSKWVTEDNFIDRWGYSIGGHGSIHLTARRENFRPIPFNSATEEQKRNLFPEAYVPEGYCPELVVNENGIRDAHCGYNPRMPIPYRNKQELQEVTLCDIDGNKVTVSVEDGRVFITQEKFNEKTTFEPTDDGISAVSKEKLDETT